MLSVFVCKTSALFCQPLCCVLKFMCTLRALVPVCFHFYLNVFRLYLGLLILFVMFCTLVILTLSLPFDLFLFYLFEESLLWLWCLCQGAKKQKTSKLLWHKL